MVKIRSVSNNPRYQLNGVKCDSCQKNIAVFSVNAGPEVGTLEYEAAENFESYAKGRISLCRACARELFDRMMELPAL